MRELLEKITGKERKKEKRIITDHMIGQKRREICALCCCVLAKLNGKPTKLVQSSTARRAVNEGAQFSENFYSNHLWNMI